MIDSIEHAGASEGCLTLSIRNFHARMSLLLNAVGISS